MSSRFVISALCIGAAAFACGPGTRNEAATQSATLALASTASVSVTQQAVARATSKEAALSATVYVRTNESPMQLSLQVVNTSKKRLELTFPSGQTHDFAILDTTGREVWRWSSGRMFTQALRNKLLGSGESLELVEEISRVNLAPGRYIARAMLTSRNYPVTDETEFTVTGATLASR